MHLSMLFLPIAALPSFAWFLHVRPGTSRSRLRHYRRQIGRQILLFAVPSLVALALLGRLDALARLPREFATLATTFGPADDSAFYLSATGGGMIVGTAVLVLRDRKRPHRPAGTIDALIPRTRAELSHAAALSITAGVAEELFFRLLAPLLIAGLTGSALLGFAIATALFAAAHRYQGRIGMLATFVLGGLFACLYLATGTLAAVMLVHAALDLIALVLRPALAGAWRRR